MIKILSYYGGLIFFGVWIPYILFYLLQYGPLIVTILFLIALSLTMTYSISMVLFITIKQDMTKNERLLVQLGLISYIPWICYLFSVISGSEATTQIFHLSVLISILHSILIFIFSVIE